MKSQPVNLHKGKILHENKDSSAHQLLPLWVNKYRPVAWLVFLTASLTLVLARMPFELRIVIWRSLVTRGILSSLLVVFSILAISLVWSAGQRLDVWAFLFFNLRGSRPIWLDRIMLAITQIGSGFFALAVGLVMFFVVDHLVAFEFILGTLTLWMVVELVKALVRRSRPIKKVAQARIVGLRARGRSFPSGHTSQAFFIATLAFRHFHASVWTMFALYAIALLVGVTRVYVGAHYPRDVMAGAILGCLWGLLPVII